MKPYMRPEILKTLEKQIHSPDFVRPWLDRFYEPEEIDILVRFNEAARVHKSVETDWIVDVKILERLLKRGVLKRNKMGAPVPADFHTRYDIWAVFEGFKDLPEEIRNRLNKWELDAYIRRHKADVETLAAGNIPKPDRVIPRYLLLDETLAVLDEADQFYLWPCNCRSMIQACTKPVYVCIRFENSQGQGYEISREKAKQIVRDANKSGLMQSGELGRDEKGKLTGAVCNCCPDCCFPHLLAKERGVEKLWPVSRYLAKLDGESCNACGLCAKRCPFHAFGFDRKKEKANRLSFDPDHCRGCGLCAETCPGEAIRMEEIDSLY